MILTMAQSMNRREAKALAVGRVRVRTVSGLDRLLDVAGRGRDDDRYVAALLGAVADELERRQRPSVLPEGEQRIWETGGAVFSDPVALERSQARKVAAFADLIDRSILGDTALADFLGVDRSRISQRHSERSIYAFEFAEERCYPGWQFAGHRLLRGLRPVLAALDPALHPLVVDHWFTTPNIDLAVDGDELSPVLWLATGGDAGALVELVPGG